MAGNFISRGFRGRRREDPAVAGRVPPGQYLTPDFPVLSAGPTPRTPLAQWDFTIRGAVQPSRRWTWDEFRALPSETITVDIHCVTKWSKLDTVWEGVAVDTLLDGVETDGAYVTAFCDGGYTTNVQLAAVAEKIVETPRVMTVRLESDAWPGHLPGQHVDVRLTADDGYQAQRSYSIASAPAAGSLDLTVEEIADGEVSPYLSEELRPGDRLELRGPIGGYFTWTEANGGPLLPLARGPRISPP